MKVVSVKEMQRIETESDRAGHSYSAMMEEAGRCVARAVDARQELEQRRVLVLVGPGNNGGDGLVAARYLRELGAKVACYLYRARDPLEDHTFQLVLESDVEVVLMKDDEGWPRLQSLVAEADVLVDALLGTGTRLPLKGKLAEMLAVVGRAVRERRQEPTRDLLSLTAPPSPTEQSTPLIVGVDGPTGLAYDSGELDDAALWADVTVALGYPKQGHFRFPGAAAVGELVVGDIGIDSSLAEDVQLEVVTPHMMRDWLPRRSADAHKGDFGRAMIVAGSVNYTGAAYLAGASATRAGAGLVTLALPSAIHGVVGARLAEATYVLLPQAMGVVSPAAADVLRKELDGYDAMLIGPGLGKQKETAEFLRALLGGGEPQRSLGFLQSQTGRDVGKNLPPLVIDADGLNIMAEWESWPERLPRETVLTPHPGEMARLMGTSVAEVQRDRVRASRLQAAAWGQVVVLKGAHTVVSGPAGRTVLIPFANPGLATAGTGDVLAGTVVALRAQGLAAFEAAAAGAYVHGLAGELARKELGVSGMVAGDVVSYLTRALRYLYQS